MKTANWSDLSEWLQTSNMDIKFLAFEHTIVYFSLILQQGQLVGSATLPRNELLCQLLGGIGSNGFRHPGQLKK